MAAHRSSDHSIPPGTRRYIRENRERLRKKTRTGADPGKRIRQNPQPIRCSADEFLRNPIQHVRAHADMQLSGSSGRQGVPFS